MNQQAYCTSASHKQLVQFTPRTMFHQPLDRKGQKVLNLNMLYGFYCQLSSLPSQQEVCKQALLHLRTSQVPHWHSQLAQLATATSPLVVSQHMRAWPQATPLVVQTSWWLFHCCITFYRKSFPFLLWLLPPLESTSYPLLPTSLVQSSFPIHSWVPSPLTQIHWTVSTHEKLRAEESIID